MSSQTDAEINRMKRNIIEKLREQKLKGRGFTLTEEEAGFIACLLKGKLDDPFERLIAEMADDPFL